MIKLKRVYETPAEDDGPRYLVDRLWPRGQSKAGLQIKAWLKNLAPSPELRRFFCHDAGLWEQFQERYRQELAQPEKAAALAALVQEARQGNVTLVYAAKDEERNNALVLAQVIQARLARKPAGAKR